MKLVRFAHQDTIRHGMVEDDTIIAISGGFFGPMQSMEETFAIEDVRLMSPTTPSKVVAVGLNYRDHAEELGMPLPSEPILFLKPPTSVVGHDYKITYPPESQQVDYEAELVVVMRERCHRVQAADVADYVLGYTCGNDVTARDLQKKDGQWTRAKSFDSFAPLGPYVETEADPRNLWVECFVNGEMKQSSSTMNMIFDVYELVSFVSHVMTLLPGDVIMTGTPPGVGRLQPRDLVEVRIEGVGSLTNQVVALH
ncbi:MAG: FAA hydrolase family protein [Actinobacteria bacterium]|nr:MAG: FAA hydrolase family protein [Actinomycetota bacterium]